MIYFFIILISLLYFNYFLVFENFEINEDNQNFEKYKKYSKLLKNKYGSCNYTDSYIIEELPQVSWNGYFINNLFIKKEYRRRGYGTILMRKLIQISQKEGKLHLISQVVAKNKGAVRLHDNLGFVVHSKGLNKNNEVVLIYVYYL